MTDDSARSEMLAIEDTDAEKEVDAEEMASEKFIAGRPNSKCGCLV